VEKDDEKDDEKEFEEKDEEKEEKKGDDAAEEDKDKDDAMDEDKDEKEDDDDEEEDDKDKKRKSEDDDDEGRPKRKRRNSKSLSYRPEDFTQSQGGMHIIKGRGEKLGKIPSVKACIDKFSANSEEMLAAHKLLFIIRGKVPKKDMKRNILEFSGYLKEIPKVFDKVQLEEEDEAAETKYSMKAFKLSIPQIKMLCDFFNIDRSSDSEGALDKEALIDRLLDFVGAPDPDLVNDGAKKKSTKNAPAKKAPAKKETPKKKKSTPKKKTPSKAKKPSKKVEDEEEGDNSDDEGKAYSFALVKDHKKGDKPSDDALRQWVRAYVVSFDMDSATTKHAIKTASDKFGLDLTKQKDRIKELLAEEM
jgi:hypothetical protein